MIATAVSLEQYLNTTYEPDVEYIGGELIERHVGTQQHGFLQAAIADYLRQSRNAYRIAVFTETRLRLNDKGDHRIPGVMVLNRPYTKGKVATDVPLATFEIKSPDDTFDEILNKCFAYAELGVPHIFVIDPDNRRTHTFAHGMLAVAMEDPVVICPTGPLAVPVGQMFSELDED